MPRTDVVVYQLRCAECGATRVGRERDEQIRPVSEKCPECDSTEYDVLAHDSEE